jgi:hypothetical protein
MYTVSVFHSDYRATMSLAHPIVSSTRRPDCLGVHLGVLSGALRALRAPQSMTYLLNEEVQHVAAAVLEVLPFLQMKKRVRH